MRQSNPFRIGLLLYPGCMPAGLLAFADLLHAANRRAGAPLFETLFVAASGEQVDCAHGLRLPPQATLDEAQCDALLVPGFWTESAAQVEAALSDNAALVAAIARLPTRTPVWSYCTGVCSM